MRDVGIAVVGIVVVVIIWSGWQAYERMHTVGLVCTADAKLCPDGSYVGRTDSTCEFATCPPGSSSYEHTVITNGTLVETLND